MRTPSLPGRLLATTAVLVSGALLAGCSSTPDDTPSETPSASASTTASPAPSQSGAASLAAYYDQKLAWAGCGGAFQCAKLTVPARLREAERRDDPDLGDPAAHRRPGQEDRLADPQPRRPRRLGRRLRPRGPRGRRRGGPRPATTSSASTRAASRARRRWSASTTSRPTPSSPPTARPTTPPRWREVEKLSKQFADGVQDPVGQDLRAHRHRERRARHRRPARGARRREALLAGRVVRHVHRGDVRRPVPDQGRAHGARRRASTRR